MDFELKTPKTKSDLKISQTKWYQNVTIQISLAVISGFIFLVALLLLILFKISVTENVVFDMSPQEIVAAARVLEKMDLTSAPCEDFYQYTCGNYRDKTMVDLEQFYTKANFKDESKLLSIFPRLFSKIIQDPESSCAIELELAEYYYSCMDVDYTKDEKTDDIHFKKMNTRDVETMEHMDKLFKNKFNFTIGSPTLEAANWSTFSGQRPLFQWFSDMDTEPKVMGGEITAKSLFFQAWYQNEQVKINAPNSRTVNLTMPFDSDGNIHREAFDYLVEIIARHHLSNESDRYQFKKRIENNIEAFGQLLNDSGAFEKDDSYNLLTKSSANFRKWKSFFCNFEGLIGNCDKDSNLSMEIVGLNFFEQLEDDECFSDVTCSSEIQYLSALHHVLLVTNYTYYGLFYHVEADEMRASIDREIKCLHMFNDNAMLAEIASVAYMKRYLGRDMFLLMDRILVNVRAAGLEMLNSVEDEKTRDGLKNYLEEIQTQKYEDLLDCDTLLEKFNLPKMNKNKRNSSSLYVLRWWNLQRLLQEIYDISGPPLNGRSIISINAFYRSDENLIEILPFLINSLYYKTNPLPLQYASLGTVIGHEFFHSLDPKNMYNYIVDYTGAWDNKTGATYTKFFKCIVGVIEQNGIRGYQTVREIFSDVMGMKAAFKALTSFEDSTQIFKELRSNPGFQLFTPEQLFFIGFGQLHCGASVNEAKLANDYSAHPPGWSRLNIALTLNREFGRVFSCEEESKKTWGNHCQMW